MVGFRIRDRIERPAESLVESLRKLSTPAISDGMNKFNIMDSGIHSILEKCKIAGPALTVRMRPGDNLMLHKCLGMITPGDVVVIDTCGCRTNSVLGDLIATAAFAAGAAGIVVDGAIRDIAELKEKQFAVFTRCITPAVGDKDGPGEINFPIACGGVPVLPGDIVIGDENGVVVVPPGDAQEVLQAAEKKLAYEEKRRSDIDQGIFLNPKIDEQLRGKGVIE